MSKTMSENRESLELNGVTFYFVRNENYYMAKICNDIDIEAGIEEVTFEFDKIGNYELIALAADGISVNIFGMMITGSPSISSFQILQ